MLDNQKPLKDWTLGEVKEYCRKQSCNNCIFNVEEQGDCLIFLNEEPAYWDLSEKPKYSKEDIEKLKAIKVLYPGAKKIYDCSFSGENNVHITWGGTLIKTKIKFNSLERNKTININEVLESEVNK